jgi:hypothetical protein
LQSAQVLLTPVANLQQVPITPELPVSKFSAGVIDTGDKFATGVVDTGMVSLILMVHLDLVISLRILEKI